MCVNILTKIYTLKDIVEQKNWCLIYNGGIILNVITFDIPVITYCLIYLDKVTIKEQNINSNKYSSPKVTCKNHKQ